MSISTSSLERENATMRERIRYAESLLDRPQSPGEREELDRIHSRFDPVSSRLGERAPLPRMAESPEAYRLRMMARLQPHSPRWRDVRLDALAGSVADHAEAEIRADAAQAPAKPGVLIPITTVENGLEKTRYFGDILAFMQPFMRVGNVCSIRDPE